MAAGPATGTRRPARHGADAPYGWTLISPIPVPSAEQCAVD